MLLSIVFVITFIVALPQHTGGGRNPQSSILQVKSETVRVKLLDEYSGEVISNSEVKVSSDNGIRCIRAPCPTNYKQWEGRSDVNGYVVIPTNMLQQSTNISTPSHRGGKDLISSSEKDMHGAWVVELIPNRTHDSWPSSYRLKLVDARSNRPIINRQVSVSIGGIKRFEGKTNSLGYIFFPVGNEIGGDGWVVVSGYRRTKFDWGWVNYKVKLKRQ